MLARFVPFKKMNEKWDTFTVKGLLEMGLNCVHEAAHSMYIKHVYNGAMEEIFLGDAFFGADKTILVEERVDSEVKRAQKLSTATKVVVGQACRGGSYFVKSGGGRHGGSNNNYNGDKQQQYNKQNDYINDYRPNGPPRFGRFNGNGSFGGSNGGGRGNGAGTCFICGSTGHHAKQCPKADDASLPLPKESYC
jgi:hypothetical protein